MRKLGAGILALVLGISTARPAHAEETKHQDLGPLAVMSVGAGLSIFGMFTLVEPQRADGHDQSETKHYQRLEGAAFIATGGAIALGGLIWGILSRRTETPKTSMITF